MIKTFQCSEKFQGNSVFQDKRKLLKNPEYTVKIFRAILLFRASASCSKILNDKKFIFNTVNLGHTVFQVKRKLLKNAEW